MSELIKVRGAAATAEVESAVRLLDSVLGPGRGSRDLDVFRANPELLSIALDDGRIVGGVGCDGVAGVGTVAVLESYRGRGLGRRLLTRAEDLLRERGAVSVGLGSLDGGVDFYLSCGYQAQLLVQFAPEVGYAELIITKLIKGVLAGRDVVRRDWQGHPQLWLQERSVDWELKRRIEAVAPGVVAQYTMSKQL